MLSPYMSLLLKIIFFKYLLFYKNQCINDIILLILFVKVLSFNNMYLTNIEKISKQCMSICQISLCSLIDNLTFREH